MIRTREFTTSDGRKFRITSEEIIENLSPAEIAAECVANVTGGVLMPAIKEYRERMCEVHGFFPGLIESRDAIHKAAGR